MGIRYSIALLLLFSVAAASCASPITEAQAESIAIDFVKERVRFFARSENATLDLPTYAFDSVTTTFEEGNYVVELNVSSRLGNETKSAELKVTVSSKGQVLNLEKDAR